MRILFKAFIISAVLIPNSYGFYGHITQDTTWRDTVLITGDVVIDSGVCLTIEPGTVVMFLESPEWNHPLGLTWDCDLISNEGTLEAVGLSQDSIFFTLLYPFHDVGWGNIKFIHSKGNLIQYANISYEESGIFCDSSSSLRIKNSHIGPIKEGGRGIICGEDAEIFVEGCVIELRKEDLHVCEGTSCWGIVGNRAKLISINNSTITKCWGGDGLIYPRFNGGNGVGIKCEDCGKFLISGCRIENIRGGNGGRSGVTDSIYYYPGTAHGIILSNTSGEIKNTKILNAYGGGYGMGRIVNSFYGHGYGIGVVLSGNSRVVIGGSLEDQNDIYHNESYNLINQTLNDIIATYNYWGTTDPDTITRYIFDKEDSPDLGKVIYEPWAEDSLGVGERLKEKDERIKLSVYPNPFKGKVEIRWEIDKKNSESLKIYDISGRLVKSFARTKSPEPGVYKIVWCGRDNRGKELPQGIYFIRAGNGAEIEKIVFLIEDGD